MKEKNSVTDLLLAAGMFVGLAWLLSNQKPSQEISASKIDANSSNNLKSEAVSAVSINHGWHPEEREHRSEERSFWRRQTRNSKWTLIFSGVAVLIALGAALIANWAYRETRRQADAAETQIGIAKDTARRQLRAYIFIDQVDFSVSNTSLGAVIHLKNSGQTPAYELSAWSQMSTQPSSEAFVIAPKSSESFPLSQTIVGPGTSVRPTTTLDIPTGNTAVVPAIQNGQAKAYAWGEVRYRDIFGESWCLEIRLESVRPQAGIGWAMQTTPDGNRETNSTCPNWPKRK